MTYVGGLRGVPAKAATIWVPGSPRLLDQAEHLRIGNRGAKDESAHSKPCGSRRSSSCASASITSC